MLHGHQHLKGDVRFGEGRRMDVGMCGSPEFRPYHIDEVLYCMPFVAANQFEDFMETLETDLPIHINIGSVDECNRATAEELGIEPDKMHDDETKKVYWRKKNDTYAAEQGFKDWDDLLANSIFKLKK